MRCVVLNSVSTLQAPGPVLIVDNVGRQAFTRRQQIYVVAHAAIQERIYPSASLDRVKTFESVDRVRAIAPDELIARGRTIDYVIAGIAPGDDPQGTYVWQIGIIQRSQVDNIIAVAAANFYSFDCRGQDWL